MASDYERIYAVIKRIPKGRVATYGQIARLAGIPRQARRVGYALSVLSDDRIAWHRVVNAKGEISARSRPHFEEMQRELLESEGVVFGMDGRISLPRFQWEAGFDQIERSDLLTTRRQRAKITKKGRRDDMGRNLAESVWLSARNHE